MSIPDDLNSRFNGAFTESVDIANKSTLSVTNPDGSLIGGGGGGGDVNLIEVGGSPIALGQALAASSLPVVLTAAQIATLTPPAALTNYANETGGNLAAAATSLAIMDDWDESDRAKVNLIAGQAGVQGASGAVSANTQRVVLATDVELPTGTNKLGGVEIRTSGGSTSAEILSDGTDGLSNAFNELITGALAYVYNGATWDRVRGDTTNGMLVNLGANNDVTVTSLPSAPMQSLGADATGQDAYATVKTPTANATNILVSLTGANAAIISLDAGTTDHFTVPGGSLITLARVTITSAVAIQAKNATGGSNYTGLSISIW